MNTKPAKRYLLASDFDQTLSFNDSGFELSELLGVRHFEQKVAGLAHSHLVQQGGELAYLIRHDPEYRGVRREHLIEAGRRVRLKAGLQAFVDFLARGVDGHQFSFYVVSAAPREVVVSALDGIVPADRIYGTELDYGPDTGEVRHQQGECHMERSRCWTLQTRLGVTPDQVIYVSDGGSDHVMLHVNNGDGFTVAVSDNRQLARIAQSAVLSDNASSVLVPVSARCSSCAPERSTAAESTGLVLDEWQHRPCVDSQWAPSSAG